MTVYGGETLLITHTAYGFYDEVLTSLELADPDGVVITIYNKADNVVAVDEASMTWNATTGRWEYEWVVPEVTTQTFYAVKFIVEVGAGNSWNLEFLRVLPKVA